MSFRVKIRVFSKVDIEIKKIISSLVTIEQLSVQHR